VKLDQECLAKIGSGLMTDPPLEYCRGTPEVCKLVALRDACFIYWRVFGESICPRVVLRYNMIHTHTHTHTHFVEGQYRETVKWWPYIEYIC
jgi:hypothetical protein